MDVHISARDVVIRLVLYPFVVLVASVATAGSIWFPKWWAITHPGELYQLMASSPTPMSAYPQSSISQMLVAEASNWGLVWMHQSSFHEVLSLTLLVSLIILPALVWVTEKTPDEDKTAPVV